MIFKTALFYKNNIIKYKSEFKSIAYNLYIKMKNYKNIVNDEFFSNYMYKTSDIKKHNSTKQMYILLIKSIL